MGFRFSEAHRTQYFTDGLTVLRGLIPASLLSDLRHETDVGRDIARQKHGRQMQRLQPVYAYDELDPQPFRDFLNLPELRATVEGTLGQGYQPTDRMAVFWSRRTMPGARPGTVTGATWRVWILLPSPRRATTCG